MNTQNNHAECLLCGVAQVLSLWQESHATYKESMEVQLELKTAECTQLHEKVNQCQTSLSYARQAQDDLEAHISQLDAQKQSLHRTISEEKQKAAEFENRCENLYCINETLLQLLSDNPVESDRQTFDAQALLLANQEQRREIEELRAKVSAQAGIIKGVYQILQQITDPAAHDEDMVEEQIAVDDEEDSCWTC